MSSISFDRIADRYEATRGGLERGERFVAALDSSLPGGANVLEIGIGTGAIAAPLVARGHDVVGIDLSREMLRLATRRLPDRLVEGDAAHLPFVDGCFDAVVAVWAVHVVGDRESLVAEVARVVRPGGVFLVVAATPDVDSNDLTDIAYRTTDVLRQGLDRSKDLAPGLAALGFEWEGDAATDEYDFDETPAERAASIERRDWSSLWDVDDTTWAEHVQPVIDELRALPEPDRPRRCVHRHVLSVYRLTA